MKFKYTKYTFKEPNPITNTNVIYRPVINIEIKKEKESLGIPALVDSGADNCLCPRDVADYLGLNITDGIKNSTSGVKGERINVYYHKVTLVIGGHQITTQVGFLNTEREHQLPFAILGHFPIFDKYKVIFNDSDNELELRPMK